ncbi:MAG: sodium:proton antiporter [Lachnospiraceae bacterium]|nr:sodium:proton antiporter [Lachnospiraceae bacterium]
MYIILLLLWIVFNGKFTWEIFVIGAVVCAALYWFICKFMGYSIKNDIRAVKKIGQVIGYIVTVIVEVIKANGQVIHFILTSKYEVQPKLIRFKTSLKNEVSRVALANCITLTPGTITVSLEEDEYVVHCLDEELAEGMENSVFVQKLRTMEGTKEE